MGGVAEQGHPADMHPGQWRGQFAEVMVEYANRVRVPLVQSVQQCGYRIVPRTEAPGQLRVMVGFRLRAGAGNGGGVDVDAAIGEWNDAEPLASPPGFGSGLGRRARTGKPRSPSGFTGVTQSAVSGEELSAQHAAHAVRRQYDVGTQVACRRTHDHGVPASSTPVTDTPRRTTPACRAAARASIRNLRCTARAGSP